MSEPVAYPYATGELLERPANYSYSRFGGAAFLDAWRAQRSGLAAHAGSKPAPAPAPAAPTDLLLEQLAQDLQQAAAAPDAIGILQRLLQRFEVTKRLHASYNERWRPVDPSDYRGAARYLRFAEVLEQAYARDAHLPFLNGLLKCMDTLSTLAAELDPMQARRLHGLVIRERAHVERLALPREQRA